MIVDLGGVKVGFVIHFTALLSLGTIVSCYCMALAYGHVQLWPVPMISDCAVKPPEMFPFRLGVVSSALLMALQSVLIFLAGVPRSKMAMVLGVMGSMALAVVGVVNEDEASKVHSITAVFFFLIYWFNMITLTILSSRVLLPCYYTKGRVGAWTVAVLVIRQALTIACGTALVLAAIVSSSHWDKNQAYLALCEWFGTFSILLYNWTFATDLTDVSIAEVRNIPASGKDQEHVDRSMEKKQYHSIN